MTTAVRVPAGRATPHGAYYFLKGTHPRVKLKAYDGSVEIDLMGGGALPDPIESPECVQINGPIKGLIAPWKFVDQQGANEDGATYLDSVNEPAIVEIPVRIVARDGQHLRDVVDKLFSSIDKARTSQLSWFTFERGFWWADVRWADKPPGGLNLGGQHRSLQTTLVLRSDRGAWRTYDDVAEFRFAYESLSDTFDTDYTAERAIGPDWAVFLSAPGRGYPYASRGSVRWRDDPNRFLFTEGASYVATHKTFSTETDNQVNEIMLDTMLELGGRTLILGRYGRRSDGAWNGYGVGAWLRGGSVQLLAFNNFHETVIRTWPNLIPPLFGEKWRLECGGLDGNGVFDERVFQVKRGEGAGITTLYAKDEDAASPLGVSFRGGGGFGGYAAGALVTQGTPAAIRKTSAGDATATTQSGFLRRINIGDTDRYDEYTLVGPGTFQIAAAAGSADVVEFGPLLPNQVVQLRTDTRRTPVVDLTRVPPTADELVEYRQALKDLDSFAPIANIGPTREANASAFGVTPPQGNMHRMKRGSFTRPIPPKSPGRSAEPVQVAVSISGGNGDSAIRAMGTNLRRYPQ